MALSRVLIGTTEGAVEVRSLDETGLKSGAVCSDKPYRRIPEFTDDYHDFVDPPLGIIGRFYGEKFFRLEVSSEIQAGQSWQLGVFIAHALHAAGRLANTKNASADTVVFATGKVEPDLSVSSVGEVERKLQKAFPRLAAEQAAGRRVIALWPKTDHEQALPQIEILRKCGVLIVGYGAGLAASASGVGTVRSALEAIGLQLPDIALAAPGDGWTGSPFRGLEPFDEEHNEIFCGRGRAREEVLERLRGAAVRDYAFLLIHGRSGVGKSSLARAGLLGDLARRAKEADVWRRAVVLPCPGTVVPVVALAGALKEAVPEIALSAEAFADAILLQPQRAATMLTTALAQASNSQRVKLVILVDQLEQLLLWAREQADDEAAQQRDAFADMLSRLARSGVVWVVTTLRSDLIPLLADSPVLSQLAKDDHLYRLEQPNRAELREIVRRPAEKAGISLEGRDDASGLPLVDVLVEAAAPAADSLLLLEFMLDRLYEHEGRSQISYQAYVRLGGLEGAIGRWADDTVTALGDDAATARAVEDVLLQLGRLHPDTGAIVARTATLDEVFLTPDRAKVVSAFEKARLLIRDTIDGKPVIRVAHEALLTHWTTAAGVLSREVEDLRLRDTFERQAAEWQTSKGRQRNDLLIRGTLLKRARALLRRRTAAGFLSAAATALIKASLRQRTWRGIRTILVFGAAAALCGLAAINARQLIDDTNDQVHLKDKQLFHAEVKSTVDEVNKAIGNMRIGYAIRLLTQQMEKLRPGDDPEDRLSLTASLAKSLSTGGFDTQINLHPDSHSQFYPLEGTSLLLSSGKSLSLYDTEAAVRLADLGGMEPPSTGESAEDKLWIEQVSPDQRYVLVSQDEGSVGVYDLTKRAWASRSVPDQPTPPYERGRTQLFADVARYAFQRGQEVILYDFAKDRRVASYRGHLRRKYPDTEAGGLLVVYDDNNLKVIDPADGAMKWSRKFDDAVAEAGTSLDNSVYALDVAQDKSARFSLFDACGCHPPKTFPVGKLAGMNTNLFASPYGGRMVLISDGFATLWDTASGMMLARLWQGSRSAEIGVRFIANGRKVLIFGYSAGVLLFDADTGAAVNLPIGKGDDLSWTDARTGRFVVLRQDESDETGQTKKSIFAYDAKAERAISDIRLPPSLRRSYGVIAANNRVLVVDSANNTAWRFSNANVAPDERLRRIDLPPPPGVDERKSVVAAAILGSSRFVTVQADGQIALYEVLSPLSAVVPKTISDVLSQASAAVPNLLLGGRQEFTISDDGTRERVVSRSIASLEGTREVVASPDGSRLLAITSANVVLVSLSDLKAIFTAPASGQPSATFAAQGSRAIIAAGNAGISIVDSSNGAEINHLPVVLRDEGADDRLVLDPDARRFATIDTDGKVDVFEAATGDHLARLDAPESVTVLAWAAAQPWIAAAGLNGAGIFDANTGRRIWWNNDRSLARAIGLSPDSSMLAIGTTSAAIAILRAADGKVIATGAPPIATDLKSGPLLLAFSGDGDLFMAYQMSENRQGVLAHWQLRPFAWAPLHLISVEQFDLYSEHLARSHMSVSPGIVRVRTDDEENDIHGFHVWSWDERGLWPEPPYRPSVLIWSDGAQLVTETNNGLLWQSVRPWSALLKLAQDRIGKIYPYCRVASLYAEPRKVFDTHAAAAQLSPLLHISADEVEELLNPAKGFVWIARRLATENVKRMRELQIPYVGVACEDESGEEPWASEKGTTDKLRQLRRRL